MKRKRAEKKLNKTYKKIYSKILLLILIAIIILISSFITMSYLPTGKNNETEKSDGKWQFALDTSKEKVGSYTEYSTGYIPTIVIIDVEGRIVHKSAGVHTKEDLLSYVEQAKNSSDTRTIAPDFTLTTFSGKEFKLSNYKGKPVILDIMAVRCPPCHQQMPELYKLKKELGNSAIILSIDVDASYGQEDEEDVRNSFGEYIKD